MNAIKFLSSYGYKLRHTFDPRPGWMLTMPGGETERWENLIDVERIAYHLGWEPEPDENGWFLTRDLASCNKCGYRPGFMNMYKREGVVLCADCRPENETERNNRLALMRCEAAYLKAPEGGESDDQS